MKDFVERMIAEESELTIKINNLDRFIKSDKFVDLSGTEQQLLQGQLYYMKEYCNVLSTRINYYQNKDGEL